MSRITLNSGTQHQYTPSGTDIQGNVHLDKLSDVTVTSVQNNQILKYDSTQNQWVNTSTGAVTTLDSLSDVVITSVSDGQVLKYDNATSRWVNGTDSASVAMADITDVTITSLTNGQVLQYNSTTTEWENTDVVANSVDGGTY